MKEVQNEKLFQQLDNEVAASCSGGVLSLYKDDNFRGVRVNIFNGAIDLRTSDFNNNISSIQIVGNERWAFYRDIAFRGIPVILGSGSYTSTDLRRRGIPNDSISSIRRIT